MLSQYMDRAWTSAKRKGPIFAINFFVLGTIAIVLVASFAWPDGIISRRNTVVRLVAAGIAASFWYYALVFGRRGNNWLFAIFATLVIAAEMLLRVAGTLESSRPATGWRDWWQLQPYYMFSGPVGGTTVTPASMGGSESERITTFGKDGFLIEGEVVKPKPANEFRVFVLGGSTLVLGAPPSKTIPRLIETHLRAGGLQQVRVYNFGVVAFVSGQQLALLVHRLAALEPDLVIAYDGGNDLYTPWMYDPRPGYPVNFSFLERAIPGIPRSAMTSKTIGDFVGDSAIGEYLLDPKGRQANAMSRGLRQQIEFGTPGWKQKIVEAYAANIVATCRFSRANSMLFAEFFQPTLHYSPNLVPDQVKLAGGEQLIQGMLDERAGVLATFAKGIPPYDPGCRFSDLSSIFEKHGSEYFWDLIHVDNRGNEVIGKRIADELLAWEVFRKRAGRAG